MSAELAVGGHSSRVLRLADVFARLGRPDLATPLLQRLGASEPTAVGLGERLAALARLAVPPDPPPPLEPSAAGLRPEGLLELCIHAGALAVARDLVRGLVSQPLKPVEAAENFANRLLALERMLRRLARRETDRTGAPRPSVRHAEQLIAQGRLFDAVEECRLVLERGEPSTEGRMWVRDLEILLAPVPDVYFAGEPQAAFARAPTEGGGAAVAVAAAAIADTVPPHEGAPSEPSPAPPVAPPPGAPDDYDIDVDVYSSAEMPRLVRGAAEEDPETRPERGSARWREAARPAPSSEDTVTLAPAPAPAPERAPARSASELEVTAVAVPHPGGALDLAAIAAAAEAEVENEVGEDERTDHSLVDPEARRLVEKGDLRGALEALRAALAHGTGGDPSVLAALERLCGPGPSSVSAVVTDAETALVGGELGSALDLYTRAAEERPDELGVVRRARDLRFVLHGGRLPPLSPPRASFSTEELRRVLQKRVLPSKRAQASVGLWGRGESAPSDAAGERDPGSEAG